MGIQGKLRTIPGGYAIYCPGCSEYHAINHRWQLQGVGDERFNSPTIRPSILVQDAHTRCHAFITAGVWHYLADCTHALTGQKIPMRDESTIAVQDELERE